MLCSLTRCEAWAFAATLGGRELACDRGTLLTRVRAAHSEDEAARQRQSECHEDQGVGQSRAAQLMFTEEAPERGFEPVAGAVLEPEPHSEHDEPEQRVAETRLA